MLLHLFPRILAFLMAVLYHLFQKNKLWVADGATVSIRPFTVDAKALTLENSGQAEVNIGGWTLSLLSGDYDEDESSYRFPREASIPAGGSCKIHSAGTEEVS